MVIRRGIDRFNLTSKVAIIMSVILTFGGMILFFVLEYSNPATLGDLNFVQKVLASYFQSVTLRTAGFNTIPLGELRNSTIFMCCILMFIGASRVNRRRNKNYNFWGNIILCYRNSEKERKCRDIQQKA